MGRDGLLIGEISARSGVSRKALRLYETNGILPAPRRTASRYRMYGPDALAVLAFVKQAKRLGFQLKEIKEIVAIRRSGSSPCVHVRRLVERKATELGRRDHEAAPRCALTSNPSTPRCQGGRDGKREDVLVPGVHRLS